MKLLFKERFFSWLDSYDIYNEAGETVFTVEGRLSLGHCLDILSPTGEAVAQVKEEIFTFLPRFRLYLQGQPVGEIKKEFTFLRPKFTVDCNGWDINGDFWEWEYAIENAQGETVASISKAVFTWADTYVLDIPDPTNALAVLMVALAIDAAKCAQS